MRRLYDKKQPLLRVQIRWERGIDRDAREPLKVPLFIVVNICLLALTILIDHGY